MSDERTPVRPKFIMFAPWMRPIDLEQAAKQIEQDAKDCLHGTDDEMFRAAVRLVMESTT